MSVLERRVEIIGVLERLGVSTGRLEVARNTVAVLARAEQGMVGPPGPTGATLEPISWNYGDAARVCYTFVRPFHLRGVTLEVLVALNGVNPELELKIVNGAVLIPRAFTILREVSFVELQHGIEVDAGTALELSIFPGSSTVGSGKILLEVA